MALKENIVVLEKKFPSHRSNRKNIVDTISSSIIEKVKSFPMTPEELYLVLDETITNAMEHGNESRPEAQVTVNLKFTNNTLTVSVKDEGIGIREFPEVPDIQKQIQRLVPPRGLGIFLIKRLVDHVEFNQRAPGGHVVRIVMKLTR